MIDHMTRDFKHTRSHAQLRVSLFIANVIGLSECLSQCELRQELI